MAKKKYDLSSLDGLSKMFDDAVEEMAQEVLFRIENIYETAIDRFYADYNPLYYNRTYSTYLASSGYDNLFSPQNIHGSGNQWTAGITVGPANIPGKPYRADTDWVFDRTFNKGIHGIRAGKAFGKSFDKKFLRVYDKANFTFIKMQGDRRTLKKQYYHGLTVSRRGKYFYTIKGLGLGAPKYGEVVMSNMNPTPRGIVGAEFRKLTQKKNMRNMFDEIFSSKFK